MASPTRLPTVFGLMMSSERSTLVRRWPSPDPVYEVRQPHGLSIIAVGEARTRKRTRCLACLPKAARAPTPNPVSTGPMAGGTYGSVGCAVLLLCAQDVAATLSGVECRLSTDNCLALGGARAASLAANLGNGVPVIHLVGCLWWEVVRNRRKALLVRLRWRIS